MKPTLASGPWPRLQRAWDVRAACNFMGGGLGTGLILLSFIAALMGVEWLVTTFLGLAFVGFGLMMVFFEIGRPWRSLNVFLHPQTSWMTREGGVAAPLFGSGAIALAAGWLEWREVAIAALGLTSLLAIGFLYCQARILRAAKGIPTWRSPALTPYILITGLTEGAGLFAAFHPAAAAGLLVLLGLRFVAWRHYRRTLGQSGAPEASLDVLDRLWPWLAIGGHGLPALLLAAFLVLPGWPALAVIGGLLAAIFGLCAKLVLITRAARTQGFAIPRTPVRGRGASRSAATRPGWVSR